MGGLDVLAAADPRREVVAWTTRWTLGMVGDDPAQVLTRTDVLMHAAGLETPATAAVVRLPPTDRQADERPTSRP